MKAGSHEDQLSDQLGNILDGKSSYVNQNKMKIKRKKKYTTIKQVNSLKKKLDSLINMVKDLRASPPSDTMTREEFNNIQHVVFCLILTFHHFRKEIRK